MFDLRYLLEFPYTAFGEWQVVDPHANYLGLPYGEWVRNWVNWLIRPDPDQHNNGPVVYLRGLDFKESTAYGSFIRLENERIFMSRNQALLCPLMACWIDVKHHPAAEDHDKRLSKAYELVINGDHPPDSRQFSINGEPFPGKLDEYLVASPEFKLHVPSPSYGSTLGQLLDIPMVIEGDWDCVVVGYFVLIKPTTQNKYYIASNASAEDGYHTETLVEVDVHDTNKMSLSEYHSERITDNVKKILKAQGLEIEKAGSANEQKMIRLAKYIADNHKVD